LVQLFDKGMTVEKSVTLEGKKDRPYHVVGELNKFSITWGPFAEQKKIQVVLYTPESEIDPIDTINEVCSFSLRCSQLMIYFRCLCIYSYPMTRAARKSLS